MCEKFRRIPENPEMKKYLELLASQKNGQSELHNENQDSCGREDVAGMEKVTERRGRKRRHSADWEDHGSASVLQGESDSSWSWENDAGVVMPIVAMVSTACQTVGKEVQDVSSQTEDSGEQMTVTDAAMQVGNMEEDLSTQDRLEQTLRKKLEKELEEEKCRLKRV